MGMSTPHGGYFPKAAPHLGGMQSGELSMKGSGLGLATVRSNVMFRLVSYLKSALD